MLYGIKNLKILVKFSLKKWQFLVDFLKIEYYNFLCKFDMLRNLKANFGSIKFNTNHKIN